MKIYSQKTKLFTLLVLISVVGCRDEREPISDSSSPSFLFDHRLSDFDRLPDLLKERELIGVWEELFSSRLKERLSRDQFTSSLNPEFSILDLTLFSFSAHGEFAHAAFKANYLIDGKRVAEFGVLFFYLEKEVWRLEDFPFARSRSGIIVNPPGLRRSIWD